MLSHFKLREGPFQALLRTVLAEVGQTDLPVQKSWRLNERHYGGLTGLDKAETAAKHGEDQVQIHPCENIIPSRTNVFELKGENLAAIFRRAAPAHGARTPLL